MKPLRIVKIIFFSFTITITSLLVIGYFITRAPMGGTPSDDRLITIEKSIQYNLATAQFDNPSSTPLSTGRPMTAIMYDFFFNGEQRRPFGKLPEAPPALSILEDKSESIRFIWFGHSTILLEIDSIRILIDPVFSDHASPLPFMVTRFQPPVFTIDKIEDIDIILISHDHYDHLDYKTISKLKHRNLQFIVPLGVGAHLEYWGIESTKIKELDWWGSISFKDLVLTCTPAQHFSGRGILNGNTTLWASWAIQGKQQNVYFSGDSGYGKHYKQIGDRLGPFDITFLENGAYSPDWKFVHQLPEEGIQAHLDLKGNTLVPIHWGMFDLALHTWHDPITRITKEANKKGVNIITPKLGQLVSTNQIYTQEDWWTSLIKDAF